MPNVTTWRELIERAISKRSAEGVGTATLRVERSSYRKFLRLLKQEESDTVDVAALNNRNALVQSWIESGALTLATAGGDNSRWGHLAEIQSEISEESQSEELGAYLNRKICESGESLTFWATKLEVNPQTLRSWATSKNSPGKDSISTIEKLGDLLNCRDALLAKLPRSLIQPRRKYDSNPLQVALWKLKDERKLSLEQFELAAGMRSAAGYFFKASIPANESVVVNWDEKLNAGGALVSAFREVRSQQPPLPQSDRYALRLRNWPNALVADWDDLVDYKTVNSEGLLREEDASWASKDGGAAKLFLQYCEGFFGWCIRSRESGGLGMEATDLHLSLIVCYKHFYAFVRWLKVRNGRGTFTEAEKVRVGYITALFRSNNTYFFQRRERFIGHIGKTKEAETGLWNELPSKLKVEDPVGYGDCFARPISAVDENEQWAAFLYLERQKFVRFLKQNDFRKGSILTTKTGKWLVDADEVDIAAWLSQKWEEAFQRIPPRSTSPIYWASGIRNCLVLGFCIVRGFRRGTLADLEISMIPKNHETSKYEFAIPPEIFKMGDSGGSKGGVYGPLPGAFELLNELVAIYVEEARPILLKETLRAGETQKAFFVTQNGTRMSGKSLNNAMIDLVGINLHGFRYLHATDGRKKGLSDEVIAQRLCNTREMVRRMYEMTTAKHRNDNVNSSLEIVFAKKY